MRSSSLPSLQALIQQVPIPPLPHHGVAPSYQDLPSEAISPTLCTLLGSPAVQFLVTDPGISVKLLQQPHQSAPPDTLE